MHCPNCGRELAEGEVCTCTAAPVQPEAVAPEEPNNKPETAVPEQPVQPEVPFEPQPQFVPPQGAYYQPPFQQPPQYQPPQFQPQPPVVQPPKTDYPEGYKIKRKYAAVILAATLGAFGIHNFYLGDSNKGVIHILVATLGSLLFGLGFIASCIWGIVEAVQLLTDTIDRDSEGYKIQTFEEALVKTRMEAEKKND